jgi:hypothetical protein
MARLRRIGAAFNMRFLPISRPNAGFESVRPNVHLVTLRPGSRASSCRASSMELRRPGGRLRQECGRRSAQVVSKSQCGITVRSDVGGLTAALSG